MRLNWITQALPRSRCAPWCSNYVSFGGFGAGIWFLSGRKLIASAVVGVEALSRLGLATKHSLENRGFHAPGVIGPVGGAIACAAALGANSSQIMNASGIAASMSAGLLAFAKSDGGGMIKEASSWTVRRSSS